MITRPGGSTEVGYPSPQRLMILCLFTFTRVCQRVFADNCIPEDFRLSQSFAAEIKLYRTFRLDADMCVADGQHDFVFAFGGKNDCSLCSKPNEY